MGRFFQFLIGVSIAILCGAVGLLTPTSIQAAPKDKNLNIHCKEVVPWRGEIPGDRRFVPTFVDADGVAHAYCDRQTGLVLQQSPSTDTFPWVDARFHCANLTVGGTGQKGWRLLSLPELASLVDIISSTCTTPAGGSLCLPDGHPFENVQSANYWSASTFADVPTNAWLVSFFNGNVHVDLKDGNNPRYAWCGRGATDAAAY